MDFVSELLQLFNSISDEILKDVGKVMDYEEKLRSHYSEIKNLSETQRADICETLYNSLENYTIKIQTYILSFIAETSPRINYTRELIQHCFDDTIFSPETQYFFFYQITNKRFVNAFSFDQETSLMLNLFYQHIYKRYKSMLTDEMNWIPANERNEDFILVLTSQLLSLSHGPTKTSYDRCYVLQKNMNKKIFLINTAEALSYIGFSPFFGLTLPEYSDSLLDVEEITYMDTVYPFFQFNITTPSVTSITDILSFVRHNKPYFIFTIGGNSIMSDMCSNLVPTASISLAPSDLTTTEGTFQIIGRNITEADYSFIEQQGKNREHLLSCTFTSSFKPQTKHFTRSELNLPENKCLALIVGARLNDEVQDDFLQMMAQTVEHNVFYVFAGDFTQFDQCMERFPILKASCRYLSFVDDMLALNECCDIYVNPRRVGGGTSVAEALYKGLPAVTLDYGDVGVGAGEVFHVADYQEMIQVITRYATDQEFYSSMSQKAIARSKALMDSSASFSKMLPLMEQSSLFDRPPFE